MPPAKRNKGQQPRKRISMSVYPPLSVAPIIGAYKSSPMTRAILCWTQLMAEAAPRVALVFKPEEWEAIYVATRERDFDPQISDPGPLLADAVSQAAKLKKLDKVIPKGLSGLLPRLAKLDYVSCWAVLTAVFYRSERNGVEVTGDWWTLDHRLANVPADKAEPTEDADE